MVKQGDVFWINFTPSEGHEQYKLRPAIALSNDLVEQISGLTVIAPISSTKRDYPFYHQLQTTQFIHGKVMLDQARAMDLSARCISQANVKETLNKAELTVIINKLKLLFEINN